jgi:hypothetical protein
MPWWWWGCIPTLEVIVDQILPFGWSQILCTVWIAYQGNCIVQQTSVLRLDFCIHFCYMACPFLFYTILEAVPSLMEILFFFPNFVWMSPQCRYCQRAKALFKELNEQPYIVEIDLRGNIRIKSLSLSLTLISSFWTLDTVLWLLCLSF